MKNIEEPCVGVNRNRTWYKFTIQPSHKLIRTTLKIESHSRGEPTQTIWYLRTRTRKHLNEVCDPTGTRTPNLQLRRLLLYPVELSDHLVFTRCDCGSCRVASWISFLIARTAPLIGLPAVFQGQLSLEGVLHIRKPNFARRSGNASFP